MYIGRVRQNCGLYESAGISTILKVGYNNKGVGGVIPQGRMSSRMARWSCCTCASSGTVNNQQIKVQNTTVAAYDWVSSAGHCRSLGKTRSSGGFACLSQGPRPYIEGGPCSIKNTVARSAD